MVIPWTLRRVGRRQTTTPRSPLSALRMRSDPVGTGKRAWWATKSVCAGGAICRRTWEPSETNTQYHQREDFTLTQLVSSVAQIMHYATNPPPIHLLPEFTTS